MGNIPKASDDLLVKRKEATKHLINFRESFAVLHKYKMKLNQAKCTFRVNFDKLLEFIFLKRGIKVTPS